jgi:hypothetical protein
MIWHTYAENMFLPQGVEPFQPPVFTGSQWNLLPASLRQVPKPPKKHHPFGEPTMPPWPFPTYTPSGIPTFPPFGGGNNGGKNQAVNATAAGLAVGGGFAALPAVCLWVRRRTNRRGSRRG